jgi:GAF domain-containing protein
VRKFLLKILSPVGVRTHRQFRLTLRAIALFVGLLTAFFVSVLVQEREYCWGFLLFIVVIITAALEFVAADVWADQSFPYDTERKLDLMEQRLGAQAITTIASRLKDTISTFQSCDPSKVSATVHVLVELSPTADQRIRRGLLQLTDYVGPEGGKKGRITLVNQGVIGRCARTGQIETVDFSDAQEYQESMVRDFGFTEEEAQRHTKTGRSYLAVPLRENSSLIGVLYFFSTEPQVFPRATNVDRLTDLGKEVVNYVRLAGMA